jgi:ribosomal-protein-alanine N-acetyltransferase
MIANDFEIVTDRLTLRPFNENDCEPMFKLRTNLEMYKYTPDGPWLSQNDFYEFLKFAKWLYSDNKERFWFRHFFAVILKSTNAFIGYCGIGNPEFNPKLVEVFYGIDCNYWEKGYATEVTKALLNYGFNYLYLDKIVGFAQKENIASLRVLEKAGLKRNGEISGLPEKFKYFNEEPFFEITKEEWSKLNECK